MKIVIECPKCREIIQNKKIESLGKNYYYFYISDDRVIEHICPFMHIICIAFQNYKFDLLFETSLRAIKDMYYREAVATLASSLERFYEYIINVIMVENPDVEKHWKFVSNQSERQLGAFYYLFIHEFGTAPKVLPEKYVSFRNKVIHKGYIPKKEETIAFCNEVYDIIKSNYDILLHKYNDRIQKYIETNNSIIHQKGKEFSKEQKIKYKESPSNVEDNYFLENISTFLFDDFNFNSNMEIEEYIKNI